MIAPLILGGPLSRPCLFCKAPVGVWCDAGGHRARALHAARTEDAPPIVEAHVGDLVLVRYRGEHVAQLVEIGDPGRAALTVRFWRPSAQVFASPRLLEREAVIGLAPDDARTALAREELRLEEVRRRPVAEIAPGMVGALSLNGAKIADVETAEIDGRFIVAPDLAEDRGPFDAGQTMSDPLPAATDTPADPWFTSDSAPTKALPKGW